MSTPVSTQFHCIDAHTCGNPVRLVYHGAPELEGETMLDKRRFMKKELDHYRRFLMLEPRGHADMYGAVLTEPVTPDGDVGVLFLHNEGYSTMCGHGIIGVATVLVECGLIESDDDEVVAEWVHRDGEGWSGPDIDTSRFEGSSATVRFETTTTEPFARLFCFSASTQTESPR